MVLADLRHLPTIDNLLDAQPHMLCTCLFASEAGVCAELASTGQVPKPGVILALTYRLQARMQP